MSTPYVMRSSIAAKIARTANDDGYADVFGRKVTTADVLKAWRDGTHLYESFASFVLQEAEAMQEAGA